jgi:hypothetical protein
MRLQHGDGDDDQRRNERKNVPRDKLLRSTDGAGVNGHVLIVDDDQSMAETLTKAMTQRVPALRHPRPWLRPRPLPGLRRRDPRRLLV